MAKVSGIVYREGTKRKLPGAVVKATSEEHGVFSAITDNQGKFTFDDLELGKWTLVAMRERYYPGQSQELKLAEGQTDLKLELARKMDDVDESAGKTFFYGLLIGLGALIGLYVALHLIFPQPKEPISEILVASIADAEDLTDSAEKTSESEELSDIVADIKENLNIALEKAPGMIAADKDIISALANEIEGLIKADQKDEALKRLRILRLQVTSPPAKDPFLWSSEPFRFLEVLFWGLAGVLVNKIITSGWYLRRGTFYRAGIIMHIAHLVSTPLLVLVAVLLLSLVTLKFTLAGGNEVTLDLSDPRIMIAFSFIIGTTPWPLWNFIEDTARRVTGQQD